MTIFEAVSAERAEPLLVDILILPETSLLSLASVMEPMRGANRLAGRTLFDWRLWSPSGAPPQSSSGLPIAVSGAFKPDQVGEVLIALSSFNVDHHGDGHVLGLLRLAARRAKAVGGVEAGAWLMARAGLLSRRRATTHWEDLDRFAAAHPDVDVRPDRFVIDGPRFTTGGAAPALDLLLHLVRSRHGPALALEVASLFIYDTAQVSDTPQRPDAAGHLGWREPRLRRATALMEGALSDPMPISAIAAAVGCSTRRLEELFVTWLHTGPAGYYRGLRLNAGRRLVLETGLSMAEISDATGFSSASAFARAFRAQFGVSPREARKGSR